MSSFKGYKMLGVNYYSENREWAHKLANWLTNEENQLLRFTEMNVGPANINAFSSEEVKQVPAIAAVIEQAEYAELQRVGSNYWSPCGDFINALRGGEIHGNALQDLLNKLVTGITAK